MTFWMTVAPHDTLSASLAPTVPEGHKQRVTTCGRVKKGRFVIFAFPLFYSILGFQDAQMLGKTARKMSLSNPFLCAPSASKN